MCAILVRCGWELRYTNPKIKNYNKKNSNDSFQSSSGKWQFNYMVFSLKIDFAIYLMELPHTRLPQQNILDWTMPFASSADKPYENENDVLPKLLFRSFALMFERESFIRHFKWFTEMNVVYVRCWWVILEAVRIALLCRSCSRTKVESYCQRVMLTTDTLNGEVEFI